MLGIIISLFAIVISLLSIAIVLNKMHTAIQGWNERIVLILSERENRKGE